MRILNAGCGGTRPTDPRFTNMDDWEGGGHEIDEPNFVRHDLRRPLPFDRNTFDAVLFSHCLEHLDCQEGLMVLNQFLRALKPGGILTISVPDASYFRKVYPEDRNENWPRLFGVTDPPNPIPTFMQAALFFDQHKMIMTEDALWSFFIRAGFNEPFFGKIEGHEAMELVWPHLNRLEFSLIMSAAKPSL
jgi:predicted SAM-dependent methyltransferase